MAQTRLHRTTMNLDVDFLSAAQKVAPSLNQTELVHAGLQALLREAALDRLAMSGGSAPNFELPPRRHWGADDLPEED